MWVPSVAIQYFDRIVATSEKNAEAAWSTVEGLRQDLAALRAENQALRSDLQSARVTGDWLRVKVNQLEMQNTALMEKAYQIKLPVAPEIVRVPTTREARPWENFSFDDIGDQAAAALGLPVYGGLEPPTQK